MGINQQTFRLMIAENKYKPISGDVLCIGKQTINASFETLSSLVAENRRKSTVDENSVKMQHLDDICEFWRQVRYQFTLSKLLNRRLKKGSEKEIRLSPDCCHFTVIGSGF